jgi:hypothetical protein
MHSRIQPYDYRFSDSLKEAMRIDVGHHEIAPSPATRVAQTTIPGVQFVEGAQGDLAACCQRSGYMNRHCH